MASGAKGQTHTDLLEGLEIFDRKGLLPRGWKPAEDLMILTILAKSPYRVPQDRDTVVCLPLAASALISACARCTGALAVTYTESSTHF